MNFLMEIIKPGFICSENTVKRTTQSVTRTADALPCLPREPPRPADTRRARTEWAAVGDRKGHAVWRPRAPVNVWFSPRPAVTLGAKWPACLLPFPLMLSDAEQASPERPSLTNHLHVNLHLKLCFQRTRAKT